MRAEVSIPVALASAALTWGIYNSALPVIADARAVEPNSPDLAKAERAALLLSVGVAAGISILAKDSTPFVVSGLLAVGLSWTHRHANQLNSETQQVWNRGNYAGGKVYSTESS